MGRALILALAAIVSVPSLPQTAAEVDKLDAEVVRLHDQGRYAEAIPIAQRAVSLREKAQGSEHPEVATTLNNLAGLYDSQGRYAEAEPLYKRTVTIFEKVRGPDHPDVGRALNNLAFLYDRQGRYAEAEPLFKRSLSICEKALGSEHPEVGLSLNNLAALYRAQHRYADAELLFKRSLSIREAALGPEHTDVAQSLNNLAALYQSQGRYAEAEPLHTRSLAMREKALGSEHPDVGVSLNNLAALYQGQGRYSEAEPLYKRTLALREKALGRDHPDVGGSLNNLAFLYDRQGRYAEAEPLFNRSLAIREKALGPDHPDVGMSLNHLAGLSLAQNDFAGAADRWRHATALLQRRAERWQGDASAGSSKGEAERYSSFFKGLIKSTQRLAAEDRRNAQTLAMEMFETAQWATGSEAAASLAQMAARSGSGSPDLAALVRERQDLVAEWSAKDKLLIGARSEPPAKRNAAAETVLSDRLASIDVRLAAIDARLAKEFPDYAALVSPKPISVANVQASLNDDEALVLFLDTDARFKPLPEETFVWVVTKQQVRWLRSELGTAALSREVAVLRCGLDAAAWTGSACFDLNGHIYTEADRRRGKPLPFDASRAHKLYVSLFGEVAELIRGKHLLIVPSGPLTQLPFQVLVTKPPEDSDPRGVAWLARAHAITVLPAVPSLKALRRVGKPSAAKKPILGFGNPLLDGPDKRYAELAEKARTHQHCPETAFQRLASLFGYRSPVVPFETRGGLADLAHLKAQVPLPETADELCAVARDVGADPDEVHLGARASEREVKRLSAAGTLADYRTIHFATHGALAGELDGTHEPGLLLTPPDKPSDEDDGYLSASEVAGLKLDADWVILSACNTAGGGAEGAEALSGLARAFFYAQARALLVSHWAVNSEAAVTLITTAMRVMAKNPRVGRAEALRRAMLAMIDDGEPDEAHPSSWAPFVVVGEGSVGR